MTNKAVPLEDAIQSFDRQAIQQRWEAAAAERLAIVKRFPIDQWPVDAIKTRREKIVDWALKRWHADDAGVTPMMRDEVNEDLLAEFLPAMTE